MLLKNILLLNTIAPSGCRMIKTGRCQIKIIPGLSPWPPIDLAEIAASLMPLETSIKILDAVVECSSYRQMIQDVINFSPEILVFQNTTPTVPDDLDLCAYFKKKLPFIKIITFGLHGTVRPNDLLETGCIDFVIRGEPELTCFELCKSLISIQPVTFKDIEGISYRQNSKSFNNIERPVIKDLDSLPFAARDLLNNNRYILTLNNAPFSIIRVSRGCPHGCIYCTSEVFYKDHLRKRSPQNIIEEIKQIIKKHSIDNFIFLSDTFNGEEDWVLELCSLIIKEKLNITWSCNSRIDFLTPREAKLMRQAGNQLISCGIETNSEIILINCHRKIKMADIIKGVKIAKENNIKILGYFILGLPGETRESMNATIKFSKTIGLDYAYFYTATPFPGTKLFNLAKEQGWLKSFKWNKYHHGSSSVLSYPTLDHKTISKSVKKAYRNFYIDFKKIKNELLSTKSKRDFINKLTIGFKLLREFF